MDELDASIRDTLAGLESRKLMVFHPAWSYFARDYDLEMIPAQIEGGDPSAAEMADLIRAAKQHKIKVIFAQPEFSTRSAKTIADEIGGEVLLISPLAPDWLDNLQRVADTFSEVLARAQ
jgi:zinc transport system substrate-binding protein